MTLDQLRIFVAVAEHQHVTAASRVLNLSQSAVSSAIAALEDRHQVRLFDRVGRGIVLTEVGTAFLGEARAVLARVVTAELTLDDLGELKQGRLRLVASQTIAAYWLPQRLATFQALYPGLRIDTAIANTRDAATSVRDGAVDLGFVEGAVEDPGLHRWEIGQDRLALVCAGPPQPGNIDADWLRAARWVVREPGSGTRSSLDAALRALGIDPATLAIALTLPSNESVRTAVEAGAGVAVLSGLVVAPALAAGTLHRLPLELGRRPFFGLHHRERHRSKAVGALLAHIADGATGWVI